ncbi:hypothetical protein, partial [Eggerthella sinensis]|uniref:hypothetical protein n=1 Tax=Eggerthella sinensis TaxID=242230 RepID=UPI0022E2538D
PHLPTTRALPPPTPPPPAPASARFVLGIDVGGTHTKVGAFSADGVLIGSRLFDSQRVLADGSHAHLSSEIVPVLEQANVDPAAVVAVGLAVPGTVAAEEALKLCPNIDLDLRSYKAFLRSVFPRRASPCSTTPTRQCWAIAGAARRTTARTRTSRSSRSARAWAPASS